jgi:hypothetical protein
VNIQNIISVLILKGGFSIMIKLLFLTFSLMVPLKATAKKNVCTITINSKQEKEVFQSKLNPRDFNFVELTDYSSDKKSNQNDWFEKACEAQVQCDILLISGHFGGSFFGSTNYSLGLNELENRSCQKRCTGILEKPKEVYLFGCNTLASKEKDHRSPEEYYQALVEHDIQPVEAERIVNARYSPIGFSNKERMERIFEGVPLIYGFSSVGPSGRNVKSSLIKYLDAIGDYKSHLEDIENGNLEPAEFLKHMRSYTTEHAAGILPTNVGYQVKENSCKLTDEKISLEDRVAFAGEILENSPFIYFPTVSSFINKNFSSNYISESGNEHAQKNLVRMTAKTNLKDKILKIFEAGGFGPGMQMDLLTFARTVRWLSEDEFKEKAIGLLSNLVKEPSLQNTDLFCSIQAEHSEFMESLKEDLVKLFRNSELNSPAILKAISCLEMQDNPENRELGHLVFESIRRMDLLKLAVEIRFSLLNLLSGILIDDEESVLEYLKQTPKMTSGEHFKEYNEYLPYLLLKKIKGEEQVRYVKNLISEARGNSQKLDLIFYFLASNKKLAAEVETIILNNAYRKCQDQSNCWTGAITGNPVVQDWVVQHLDLLKKPYFIKALSYDLFYKKQIPTSKMQDAIITAYSQLNSKERDSSYILIQVMAQADLSHRMLSQLYQLLLSEPDYKTKSNFGPASIKYILDINRSKLPELNPTDITGYKLKLTCSSKGRSTNCSSDYLSE